MVFFSYLCGNFILRINNSMAIDLDNLKTGGLVFKKGTDDSDQRRSTPGHSIRRKKGQPISGAAKMRAAYKSRKNGGITKAKSRAQKNYTGVI